MPATYLQDFIVTYEWRPQLMVDGGLTLGLSFDAGMAVYRAAQKGEI